MSSKENPATSPTDTNSVTDAEAMWSLVAFVNEPLNLDLTTTKCSNCKIPTVHTWLQIQPTPHFETDDMIEIVSKRKRLTLCTVCGTLKLIT